MNEAETRADHIDPALAAAGWGVVEGSRIRREYPITLGRIEGAGKRGKALTADYVLEYRNTKLAVVEAKAWDKPLTEGVGQAKDYAGKLAIRFTYASNGQGIYGIDMDTGAEGELAQYPAPDDLWNRTFATQNAWRERFAAVPYADKSGTWQIRFYQEIAVNRVLEQVANGNTRILLTLATGTGKTSIAFQIAWRLFQSRWNLGGEPSRRPRILFLADRNNLATQAYKRLHVICGVCRRCVRSRHARRHPQKGQGAHERQRVLYDFPDIHERAGEGRPAFALLRRVPAGFLRLHRHRRMPSRRRQRREQLARHS
jgi:type I restriction enzyme R subunit